MIKTAQDYWDKVAMLYFEQLGSLTIKLEVAEELLSQDEFNHLKELIKDGEIPIGSRWEESQKIKDGKHGHSNTIIEKNNCIQCQQEKSQEKNN